MNISNFKIDDAIVRTRPAKPLPSGLEDRSFIGDKLIFKGIANGCIYFKLTGRTNELVFGDKLLSVAVDLWDEGWEYYIDPNTLSKSLDQLTLEEAEIQLKIAVNKEEYEKAEELKKYIHSKSKKDG